MSKIFKCDACGHISRLAKNKIKHSPKCTRTRGRAPKAKAKRVGKWKPTAAAAPAVLGAATNGQLLDRDQFIAKLLSIKGARSLHQFAPMLGVSYQFLGHVVKGDFPPGPKIAAALGYVQDVYFKHDPDLAKKAVRAAAPDKMPLPI